MPRRPYVARTSSGLHATIREYPLKSGEVPQAGDIVHLDSNEEVVRTTSADPTPLLGLAEDDYDSPIVEGTGRIRVAVFTEDVIIAMEGDNAPTVNDVNQAYGIARDGNGVWTLDGTDTSNTRVFPVDFHLAVGGIGPNLYFCKVLAAHRQSAE